MISRVIDVLLAFPGLLLAIAPVAVLGPSLGNVLFALTIIGWVGYARVVRGQVLRARELEHVQAARAAGAGTPRILWRHCHSHGDAGRGGSGDAGDGRRDHRRSGAELPGTGRPAADAQLGHDAERRPGAPARCAAPHRVPRLAIALLVLGFNFLGDGLHDATDPRKQLRIWNLEFGIWNACSNSN